jgi:hypothetical protein
MPAVQERRDGELEDDGDPNLPDAEEAAAETHQKEQQDKYEDEGDD